MGKAKIPIIITSCVLAMVLLTGFLLRKNSSDKDKHIDIGTAAASTVSPGAITLPIDNSGNYTYIPPTYEYDDNKNKEEDQMSNNTPTKAPWTPATEMDLDPNSITVYVNKEYCLPKDFVPENLLVPNIPFDLTGNYERKFMRKEAAEAIEKMFAAASEDGLTLYGISGYRSYARQKEIFLNNIVHKGKRHTLRYSAVPGTSEHQTGLAMDVSSKSIRYKLVASFAKTDEGKWLANHAHEFGFIVRYPMDQYDVTGYAYEPWHIRYLGEDLANYLYVNNMTLDEYYKYQPSEGFNYEEMYADLINYKPPVTPTPIPEEELEEDPLADLDDDDLEDSEDEDIDGEDSEADDVDGEDSEVDDVDGENSKPDDVDGEDSKPDDVDDEDSEADDGDDENSVTDDIDAESSETGVIDAEGSETNDLDSEGPNTKEENSVTEG